ncbi:MAG TPA: hypothetical protein VFB28_08130 [Terriglobales bacterium]|nr:hypothetical protein [Terriglobales bacterium]
MAVEITKVARRLGKWLLKPSSNLPMGELKVKNQVPVTREQDLRSKDQGGVPKATELL